MKIIDYDSSLGKEHIAQLAYSLCNVANFPVTFEDVYLHLFANDTAIVKLLIEGRKLLGFGVFENYKIPLQEEITTMLYLSGMVIDPSFQGKNLSSQIIKRTHEQEKTDFISLRTQNIAMVKSLLNSFHNALSTLPGTIIPEKIDFLKQIEPFQNINEKGVVKNCYERALYPNTEIIKNTYGIELSQYDALAVMVEPKNQNQKVLSRFKNKTL